MRVLKSHYNDDLATTMQRQYDYLDLEFLILDTQELLCSEASRARTIGELIKATHKKGEEKLHDELTDYMVEHAEEQYKNKLTGAMTRDFFEEHKKRILHRAQSYGGSQGYVFIDLDHFKMVNDQYGHDGGDQVLSLFGQATRTLLQEQEYTSMFVRYGGDEFLIVTDGTTRAENKSFAEELKERFSRLARDLGYQALTFSAGIAMYDQDGQSVEDLVKRADQRIYRAKKQGRNMVQAHDFTVYEKAV